MLHRRWTASRFEYGDVDVRTMTDEAARVLHGVEKGSRKIAKDKRMQSKINAEEDFTSLIPEALRDLEESGGTLAADAMTPMEEVDRRAKALAAVGAPPFRRFLKDKGVPDLVRKKTTCLQLNIGLYCNQACTHCHVESSPLRSEMAPTEVVDRVLHLLRASPDVITLDITGGAPELNAGFRRLVEGAAQLRDTSRPKLRIIDRCNLTVLLEPGQEDLLDFLVRHRVQIIASLPSYDATQTDRQRGRKVFERSMKGLKMLNARGYGQGDSKAEGGLLLDLVFNPPGPFLPPRQELLEVKYREELKKEHDIEFNRLITIANIPVKRFFDFLNKKGTLEGYLDLLVRNFNPETVPLLMCSETVSVRWDGRVYDCDFNQQLELELRRGGLTVFDLETLNDEELQRASIKTGAHCFGCTAAQGSS
jgi:radical SAM/Cys-rich protein